MSGEDLEVRPTGRGKIEDYPHITESELLGMLARPQFGDPSAPWCGWFAWHPVLTVDGRFPDVTLCIPKHKGYPE